MARIVLENGDMKGIRSFIYTQHSFGVIIIGARCLAKTAGNAMTRRTICHAATFGIFMSVS